MRPSTLSIATARESDRPVQKFARGLLAFLPQACHLNG
jgi:hypothetical protein